MMKKKILAAVLALCMLLSLSTVALAADDGTEATAPVGGGAGASSGAATVVGETFDVTDDDDGTGADETDTTGADISLWGRITGGADGAAKVYKLDVAWGMMRFTYTFNNKAWNPYTYEYEDYSNGGWEGAETPSLNNRITVTNHSNASVSASFNFTMVAGAADGDTIFNKLANDLESSNMSRVVGNFFLSSDYAEWAARQTTTYQTAYQNSLRTQITGVMGPDDKLVLPTADAYTNDQGNAVASGARPGKVYFSFSGIPDTETTSTLGDTNVGTITITFAPESAQQPGG